MELYSTRGAAAYLGLSVDGVKYHVYRTGRLRAEKIGKTLVFKRGELDRFTRGGGGRRGAARWSRFPTSPRFT